MARGHEGSQDSLELLLDTICNTFGGILFISLLIVILLSVTGESVANKPPSEQSEADLVAEQEQLEEQKHQLQTLRTALDQQQSALRDLGDPQARQLANQQRQIATAQADLMGQRIRDMAHIARTQQNINDTARQMAQMQQAIERAEEALNSANEQLGEEVANRSRAAKLPREKGTTKLEVPLIVKDGRLYFAALPSSTKPLPINRTDAEIVTTSDGLRVLRPKGSGLQVDPNGRNAGAITQRLSQYDSDRHYFAIVLWKASFPHWRAVQDVLVSEGFNYAVVPLQESERAVIGRTRPRGVM